MSKNLLTRIAVAAIAIPLILWISFQGGLWLFSMLGLFAILGISEFLVAEKIRVGSSAFLAIAFATVVVFLLFSGILEGTEATWAFGIGVEPLMDGMFAMGGIFLIAGMALAMGKDTPAVLFDRYIRIVWGVFYVGGLYSIVFHTGEEFAGVDGGDWLLLLFGILWVGDTAAMFTGKVLGKHKLAPSVSPNKTVEGFFGGIAGAIVTAIVIWYLRIDSIDLMDIVVIALGCSIFGQLGDLVESMWKRSRSIKDSSAIIPGHGGVLDRFDSLLFAAPFLFAYTRLFV
ncbi:MAG: phosphatidate cytidylyltransferase [Candidatus Zixiibacteriota bacterium]